MPGFDLEQVIRRRARVLILAAAAIGCGQWQRSGSEPRPAAPSTTVPALFDPSAVYRSMGYMVGDGGGKSPLSFIGSLRYLAHGSPDSTLVVFAMTLPNRGLSFHKSGTDYVADYHVDLVFRRGDVVERQISRDETVAVHSLQESVRDDESVVFQQFLPIPPGITKVQVRVRDRNGAGIVEAERIDTVPRLGSGAGEGKSLGSPIPFYDGSGREQTSAVPKLVVNPRATVPYGEELLRFYFEAYGLGGGQPLVTRILDANGLELWRDTVTLAGVLPLATAEIAIESNQFPVGLGELVVQAPGSPLAVRTPLLVTLSEEWAVANVQDLLDLLRYFRRQDLLAKVRAAPPDERAAAWREFYKATDPVPTTGTNEALDVYFQRLRIANSQFQEPGIPGWRTERGEVFITLGQPDEVFNPGSQVSVNDVRLIRWGYPNLRLILEFRDEVGFGQYRLTPESRAEYSRILEQVRKNE